MSYRGRPVTDAFIAALRAAGLAVGDGERPTNGGWAGDPAASSFVGYVVVHPVGATDTDGTLDDPDDDVWPIHQVTAFGATRAQCEQIADNGRAALLGIALNVAGRHHGRCQIDLLGVVVRIDEVQPRIFMSADRYTAFTTPT